MSKTLEEALAQIGLLEIALADSQALFAARAESMEAWLADESEVRRLVFSRMPYHRSVGLVEALKAWLKDEQDRNAALYAHEARLTTDLMAAKKGYAAVQSRLAKLEKAMAAPEHSPDTLESERKQAKMAAAAVANARVCHVDPLRPIGGGEPWSLAQRRRGLGWPVPLIVHGIELKVGQRWVYDEARPGLDSVIVGTDGDDIRVSDDEAPWNRDAFAAAHTRLRRPSELPPSEELP